MATTSHSHSHKHEGSSYTLLAIVLLALLMLTGLTVWVSGIEFSSWLIGTWVAVAVAAVKSVLVLWYFMHLKHEPPLVRLILLATIGIIIVSIGLTYIDVLYR